MNIIVSIFLILFWFIVILIPLVAIHEMGHFLFSKLMGVKIVEYGIGIPPRAVSRRWKNVIWSLNWLPLGGFAKIYGDHDAVDAAEDVVKTDPEKSREIYRETRIGELIASRDLQYFLKDNNLEYNEEWQAFENYKGDIEEGSDKALMYKQLATLVDWEYDEVINTKKAFCNVSWWRKSFILLGGVTFNLLTAIFIFFLIFGFVSTPVQPVLADDLNDLKQNSDVTFVSENVKVLRVVKDTAAERSGMQSGDDFISFNNVQINTIKNFDEFAKLVQSQSDPNVTVVYRDSETGATVEKQVKLDENNGKYYFGLRGSDLGYYVRFKSKNLGDAAVRSVTTTWNFMMFSFKALGNIVVALLPTSTDRSALQEVGGPIGVGYIGSFIYNVQGARGILNIMALLSITLAAFNLLPIPALDGGRFVIVTINAITRKRNKRLEAIVIGITFIGMLLLAGVIAFYDIYRVGSGTFGF